MSEDKQKEKRPRTEKILRCEWPNKCFIEAVFVLIDFGFNPPSVRRYCELHAAKYEKIERSIVKERMKV